MRRSREPFFWAFFSSGGMVAALILPALVLVMWIAGPLGWIETPSHKDLVEKVGQPITRLGLFVLISLSLFHWAHRFRYTLYDGLQLSHLYGLVAAVCYGGATVLTGVAAYMLWAFP